MPAKFATAPPMPNANVMIPMCSIDEYANSRLTSFCRDNRNAATTTDNSPKPIINSFAIDVCADPTFSFHPESGSSVNLPVEIIVDPRTMRITHVTEGYFSHYPLQPSQWVMDLVKRNKAM